MGCRTILAAGAALTLAVTAPPSIATDESERANCPATVPNFFPKNLHATGGSGYRGNHGSDAL